MNASFYKNHWNILLLGFILLTWTSSVAQEQKPNFILYLTDDIGWNDVGAYGNPFVETPHIDAMASRGMKFENSYLTTSSCSPSRASMISGRYPHNTGAPELHDPMPADMIMFPEILRENGYFTALSGKNHMGPHVKKAFDLVTSGKGPGKQEDWLQILRERPAEKPFFMWFASDDAHRPWQFDDKAKVYDPDSIVVPPFLFDGPVTREDLAAYYHEVSRADYWLGELINELKNQGIYQNTYIIFLSDNGRPFPRSKTRLYDSGIKTHLIIEGEKVQSSPTGSLVSSMDIAPTVLDLAGIKKDLRIQGVSLVPLLEDPDYKVRDFAFAEHNWHVFQAHERMVRYGDWLYIKNAYPERRVLGGESTKMFPAGRELWEAWEQGLTHERQEDVFKMPRPAEELFNIKDDPFQFDNLAGQQEHAEILQYLRKVLETWVAQTGDNVPENPSPDRDDLEGKRLPKEFKKGDRPGAVNNAQAKNHPGPIFQEDLHH